MGPLILHQFDATVLNNTTTFYCELQRDFQALPFILLKERDRNEMKGGKRRERKERER